MDIGITVTTPALLFPALSLLLLAYTNRFLVLAQLIRDLSSHYAEHPDPLNIRRQLDNLSRRVRLIRLMQVLGVLSLLGCVVAMLLLLVDIAFAGQLCFGASLLLLVGSLLLCVWEIWISSQALDIALSRLQDRCRE